jgi:hypothetical protein
MTDDVYSRHPSALMRTIDGLDNKILRLGSMRVLALPTKPG